MTTTVTPDPQLHPQRPWRPVHAEPRKPAVIRAFAAPVVRELPPRRELHATGW
jgi:hypothetical protein